MGGAHAVAAALERRLQSLLREPIQVVGAGRTDAGVHARCMVFHFDANVERERELAIQNALLRNGGGLPAALQASRRAGDPIAPRTAPPLTRKACAAPSTDLRTRVCASRLPRERVVHWQEVRVQAALYRGRSCWVGATVLLEA